MADARQYFDLPSPFPMKRGGQLRGARLAYEIWGTLNATRDNAMLILTGLSPSAHAASNAIDDSPGWWEDIIGPGKAIDTDRWFVICGNSLGSCKGSSGPASINPETGELYRLDFPELSLEDVGNAGYELARGLGVDRLAALVGCSMGGMSALGCLAHHPGFARAHVSVCTAPRAQPFAIAIRSLQREAIRLDPKWNDGHYDDDRYPETGMNIARKLGVITYRSALEWRGRFGRIRLEADQRDEDPFGAEFQIESYLNAHARRFARSFDLKPLLPAIACPVLAVQGVGDEYGTLAQIRGIAEALPRTVLLELEDCGHSPHRDQRERLVEAVAGFIARD